MKNLLILIFTLLLTSLPVSAQEDVYDVISLSDGTVITSFDVFSDAQSFMNEQEDAGIVYQNQLIAMKDGVVVLDHSSCTVNIDTIDQKTDTKGYVNGCYGNDGLYLRTNSTGKWILMLQSGARVWVHRDDVTLVPYDSEMKLSSYFVDEGRLFHQIRTRWLMNDYGSLIDLGQAPDYLEEDQIYLSYDGHYFYNDFLMMSHDMKFERSNLALNHGNPYFNYFMMLPHRSISNHTLEDAESVFKSLNMTDKPTFYMDQNKDSINDVLTCTQFADSLDSFFYTQAEFGSNALLMMALAMNESAYGNSSLAYRRNNLFGHAAYDSDVEGNARRYLDTDSSVISHAKNYVSLMYANPDKFMYHGSFFGDKSCGMNVSYASDPYWAEKASQHAYELDEAAGFKDFDQEALAIVQDELKIRIYDASLKNIKTTIVNQNLMSFVILDELDEFYLVQLDEIFEGLNHQTGSYDYLENTGYLKKEVCDAVLNEEMIHQNELDTVYFKAVSGTFKDGRSTKLLQFKKGSDLICETPVKKDALFVSWNKVKDHVYEAVYREIDHIEMQTMPPQTVELNVHLDLTGGSIKVIYQDGSEEIIPLSMSMVSGYDLSLAGEQTVTVSYGGSTCSYPLTVSQHLDDVRNEVFDLINQVLLFDLNQVRTEDELALLLRLKDLMQNEFYPVLTMNQITQLERIYASAFNDVWSIIIKQNDYDLELSGLHLSKDYGSSLYRLFLKDTIHLAIEEIEASTLLKKTAEAQGWQIESEFELSMTINRNNEIWEGPILFSIERPDDSMKTYRVLTLSNQHVIECHTSVSVDRIRFKALAPGEFILVSKSSVNTYDLPSSEEVTTPLSNGIDIDLLVKTGSAVCLFVLLMAIGIVMNLKRKVH